MAMPKTKKDKVAVFNKFGFTLCQQNGQRTYGGPPPNWGSRPPPSRDCEVFIGRLPRMCFEDELIPLFLTAGELYEFRLMLDFSGTNRGYGYAHYATLAGAQRAIETLNKYEIRPGHQIGVLKSKNNCRLLFGNIKSGMNIMAFEEFIRTATDQVLNVLMFKNFDDLKQTDFRISSEVEEAFLSRVPRNNENGQFAIVEYENHRAAAVARRVLIPKFGHILAIDWAVPPREKKRFSTGVDANLQTIERPLSNPPTKDSNLLSVAKTFSKVRPVPTLLVEASNLDNTTLMPKNLNTPLKFLKYQLSLCLYKSVDQLEIPLFICKEIERKIVDRVTNLENCSQAVQLIFNYFSWYNEKKRVVVNSEAEKLLNEVKIYADLFLFFINNKPKPPPFLNPSGDFFVLHLLPLQLNILFRIILRSDKNFKVRHFAGIAKGLEWLRDFMHRNDKASKDFIQEILNHMKTEDATSLDKAITLAKNEVLNTITTQVQVQNNMRGSSEKYGMQHVPEMKKETFGRNGFFNQNPFPENEQHVKVGDNRWSPFSGLGKFNEPIADAYPSVPILLTQSSITNKVPFMPDIFHGVLTYFKYLIRVYVSVSAWQMNIPQHICKEIEGNIVDRISNIENCSDGVQLIFNYFSWWIEKRPYNANQEILSFLYEVKVYADSFVNFIMNKTKAVYVPDEVTENHFCKVLPLRLNILYHMMLIFNTDSPMRFIIGITKGLNWLDELIRNADESAKEFLKEVTSFIVDLNPDAYERAKCLGKVFCWEMMTSNGQAINCHAAAYVRNNDQASGSRISTPNGFFLSGSDNNSVGTVDFDP